MKILLKCYLAWKRVLFGNEKTRVKMFFGSKNASQTQMHLRPCFSSEKEWLWRHVWLMCDLVDASTCTSLVMCYHSQPHIVTGHLKRQCLFGCKISVFGKHQVFWRDEFRISIWPPPNRDLTEIQSDPKRCRTHSYTLFGLYLQYIHLLTYVFISSLNIL